MSVLELTSITKHYGSGHTLVRAVDDVSLKVEKGEILLIMGPSGSGKTTLITMAGALLKPTAGFILIDGIEITKLKEDVLPDLRLSKIGFVFQSFNLLSALDALDNAAVPLIASGKSLKKAREKAKETLVKLGLSARLNHLPKDLSGGEKQRVSIARALITNPSIILADEPTANLDAQNGHEVMELLCATACEEGRAVVIASHDQRIRDVAKQILFMEDGKIIKEEKGGHDSWCPHCRSA